MEKEQTWRLKKCCFCMPLHSGMLWLAYFNATVIFLIRALRDLSSEFVSVVDTVIIELNLDINLYEHQYLYMLPIIVDYIFTFVLIYALHKNNESLLSAYMCYVVVYISCQLLNFLIYFTTFYLVLVATDLIYCTYLMLLVYSVRVEIRLDKMHLLSSPQQASEVTTPPIALPLQTDNMAADPEKTSL